MCVVWWCVLSSVLITGCAAVQQGPPVNLEEIAVPTIVEHVKPPPAPVALPPAVAPPSRPGFRAWIPRQVTPNGDVHEGHYVEVSEKPPQKELVKPDYEIPKAPKLISRPPSRSAPASAQGLPSGTPPPPPPAAVPPALAPQGSMGPGSPLPQEGAYEPARP